MKENIKIKIDLLNPVIFEFEYKDEVRNKFVEMITDIMESKLSIEIDGKLHDISVILKEEKVKIIRYFNTLVFKFMVDMDELFKSEEIYRSDGEKLSEEERKALIRHTVISEIKKYIMDFTFAINLAYPGFFEFDRARIYINNKEDIRSRIDIMLVDWRRTYTNFLINEWPVIHSIKFEQVWKWLNCRTNFIDGMSKTAIDRALNSLTYTMGNASYEEVFYILMGIEALYNDNKSNGIVEQIRVKTESLLKRPERFRKQIREFYDNRSDFIHGKLNFPTKYCPYDATDEFEEFFSKKYAKTVDDALSILISTIQEYIIHDANKMKVDVVTSLEN